MEGKNKSQAAEILAMKKRWFTDGLSLDAEPKVVIEQTAGSWIIEFAELTELEAQDVVGPLLTDGALTPGPAYDALDLPVFQMFTEAAEAASDTPRGQLEAFFAQLEAMVRLPEFRGCPFSNASAELADVDHPAHKVVRRHKDRIRRWIQSRAREAGAADPNRLARQLMIVFAGAQAQALVERSPRAARDAKVLANALIDAAIPA